MWPRDGRFAGKWLRARRDPLGRATGVAEKVLSGLHTAKVPAEVAHLVCIERELESWLLYDHKMLECVLSKPTHPVTVPKQKNPHRQKNPKALMTTLFRILGGEVYVDVQFAQRMADCLTALNRLR